MKTAFLRESSDVRRYCLILLVMTILAGGVKPVFADIGTVAANDDFIIILDQSGSMREKIPGRPELGYEPVENRMAAYKAKGAADAITFAAGSMLRRGDHFTVITFGDKSLVFLSQQIGYEHEREVISRHIKGLLFNDRKTDIPDSLVQAAELLKSLKTPERRKIVIMITDGANDPPADSLYIRSDIQKKTYEQLRDTIHANKWNVFLVGLGRETKENINEIARNLGLTGDSTKIVENIQNSREVTDKLTEIFKGLQEARVEAGKKDIRLTLKPGLFGGYESGEDIVSLMSFYGVDVEIKLDSTLPVRITGNDDLKVTVTPLNTKLIPRQPGNLNLSVSFTGKRPDEGRVISKYAFQFVQASVPFYPHAGNIEIILPSWWEVYGLYALLAVILMAVLLSVILQIIRRIRVPEIRIMVTANDVPLGEAMTLKIKESFVIADKHFEGRSVSAKGLSCKIAATVRYLGRRKFEVEAAEAKILDEGKEVERLQISMNRFFDLKDKEGKLLRLISIGQPGAGDPFGGSHGNDPF